MREHALPTVGVLDVLHVSLQQSCSTLESPYECTDFVRHAHFAGTGSPLFNQSTSTTGCCGDIFFSTRYAAMCVCQVMADALFERCMLTVGQESKLLCADLAAQAASSDAAAEPMAR